MRQSLLSVLLLLLVASISIAGDWRQFRGTENTGVTHEKGVPTACGHENVAWKTPLPGKGPSSPIVVGGRVIVTAASGPRQERLHALALDQATGRVRWERQLWATGQVIHNSFGGIATPTPASDGRLIFAFFSSNDLVCFDLDGNLKWFRGLGYESPTTRNDVGMASSPVVIGDTVIVQAENPGESFAMGLDSATGETRWRVAREAAANWTSPTLLKGKTPAEDLVLLQSRSRVTVHEPRTGRQVGDYEAACSTISSAATEGENIILAAGGGLTALRYDRLKGQLGLLWEERRLRCENVSPVVHEHRIYAIKSPAILVCGDAATGKILWQLRLQGTTWATPAIADGRLYVVNYDGLIQVVSLQGQGGLIGTGHVDPGILASPAIADGAVYFRSNSHLWKIVKR